MFRAQTEDTGPAAPLRYRAAIRAAEILLWLACAGFLYAFLTGDVPKMVISVAVLALDLLAAKTLNGALKSEARESETDL